MSSSPINKHSSASKFHPGINVLLLQDEESASGDGIEASGLKSTRKEDDANSGNSYVSQPYNFLDALRT